MNRIDWELWNKIEHEFEEYVRKLENKYNVDLLIKLMSIEKRKKKKGGMNHVFSMPRDM
jgi:hypothetical protein